MKASTRQIDGITIVDLSSGRITQDEGSPVLREIIRELGGQGAKKVVLNLANVSYIDNSGIGELFAAFTTLRDLGGELKLLRLTPKVDDLLQITKLNAVFDIRDDEDSAVKAFSKSA